MSLFNQPKPVNEIFHHVNWEMWKVDKQAAITIIDCVYDYYNEIGWCISDQKLKIIIKFRSNVWLRLECYVSFIDRQKVKSKLVEIIVYSLK